MEESSDEPIEDARQTQEKKYLEDLGIPNEIWAQILKLVYYASFDLSIIDKAKDIHEAMDIIEKHISKCRVTISLVCKTFNDLNITKEQWNEFRGEIREFYSPYLNKKFLEEREVKEGFYPKSGKWHDDYLINDNISIVMKRGIIDIHLLKALIARDKEGSNLKLINLLLSYGTNFNIKDLQGDTPLHYAISHNKINIVELLLKYGLNPNALNYSRRGALFYAAMNHHQRSNYSKVMMALLKFGANPNMQDLNNNTILHQTVLNHSPTNNKISIIILLLKYGANPYIKNNNMETVFDIAHVNKFKNFDQLVRTHAQNTLTKICMLHILNNLDLYEDQLHILPGELRDTINSLKSN